MQTQQSDCICQFSSKIIFFPKNHKFSNICRTIENRLTYIGVNWIGTAVFYPKITIDPSIALHPVYEPIFLSLLFKHSVSIKTLPFATFWRILEALRISSGAQHRALPRYQSEKMKIWNISLLQMGIEPTVVTFYSRIFVPERHNNNPVSKCTKREN